MCQDTELTSLQTRLQAGLVERLEEQLGQERARLGAMLDHLHQSPVSGDPISIPVAGPHDCWARGKLLTTFTP